MFIGSRSLPDVYIYYIIQDAPRKIGAVITLIEGVLVGTSINSLSELTRQAAVQRKEHPEWDGVRTISSSKHDCDLPMGPAEPVPLVPPHWRPAPVGTIIRCIECGAFWYCAALDPSRGPVTDRAWVEINTGDTRPVAIDFDPTRAWAAPGMLHPWHLDPHPTQPNGLPWWRMDFDALRASSDANRCEYHTRARDSKYRCMLKPLHGGTTHETVIRVEIPGSPEERVVYIEWSGGYREIT